MDSCLVAFTFLSKVIDMNPFKRQAYKYAGESYQKDPVEVENMEKAELCSYQRQLL
jgi:hypothetical protein